MAQRNFVGTYDPHALEFKDLARVATALQTLEDLAREGLITFRSGVARPRKGEGQAGVFRLQPQRHQILAAITGERWWSAREVADTTGLKSNSVNAQLSGLAKNDFIESDVRDTTGTAEGGLHTSIRVFRKSQ